LAEAVSASVGLSIQAQPAKYAQAFHKHCKTALPEEPVLLLNSLRKGLLARGDEAPSTRQNPCQQAARESPFNGAFPC
jgi:hypothetical protein